MFILHMKNSYSYDPVTVTLAYSETLVILHSQPLDSLQVKPYVSCSVAAKPHISLHGKC